MRSRVNDMISATQGMAYTRAKQRPGFPTSAIKSANGRTGRGEANIAASAAFNSSFYLCRFLAPRASIKMRANVPNLGSVQLFWTCFEELTNSFFIQDYDTCFNLGSDQFATPVEQQPDSPKGRDASIALIPLKRSRRMRVPVLADL